jgi:periplasmic divalent cation tolerance protein
MTKYIVVFITCSSKEEADKIANAVIAKSFAACVNIIDNVRSIFHWQEKVEDADEVLLIAKTKAKLLDEIIPLVKQLHSYDLPEIIALPILGGSEDYLNWIDAETTL